MAAELDVTPISLALTRPVMKWGVRYEIYALNGMAAIILFIGSSSFFVPVIPAITIHAIAMYFCQQDAHCTHVAERYFSMKRATQNVGFWGARSYSP